jgi:glycosyltransferase involved in cell wall biosynthesis
MRPPVTFIISAYNYGGFLEEAVQSICHGNLENDDEIIIVNDASTDNTEVILKGLTDNNQQIRKFTHRHNKKWGTACINTAIEVAQHDIFFPLDADNLLAPGSITPLVRSMCETQADAAAFQEVRFFNTDQNKPTHSWFYKERCNLTDALAGHHWPGSNGQYLYTRQSWLNAGRCDEFTGHDNWTFGIQLLASGAKMITLPNSHYFHRWGHESLNVREQRAGSLSLRCLRTLLPIIDLLEQESVDYLFSEEGRISWFTNLEKRPLRVRGEAVGIDGRVIQHPRKKDPFLRRLRWILAHKIAPQR